MKGRAEPTWLAPIGLAILVFAGFFKASPSFAWLPVDLTGLGAAIVACLVLGRVIADRGATRISPIILLAGIAVIPGFFTAAQNPYAAQARVGLVLVAATICGALLLDTEQALRRWVGVQVGVGLLLVTLGRLNGQAVERFSIEGGNTIAAGQASGLATVVLATLLLAGVVRKPWHVCLAVAGIAVAGSAMLSTGSRGPVAAAVVAVVVTAIAAPGRGRVVRSLLGLAAVYAGLIILGNATGAGAARLQLALSGRSDNTASRQPFWDAAMAAIPSQPFGIGWGNFFSALPTGLQANGYRIYPHNVLLEATLEGGWLAGAALLAFIVLALWRLARNADTPLGSTLLAIAIFFTVGAMVSGSLADNRAMFAALAVGLALPKRQARSTPPPRSMSCDIVTPSSQPSAIPTSILDRK